MKNILKIYFFRAGLTLAAPLNFFHNETFFLQTRKSITTKMKIYGKVFFSDKKFCSNTFFFSGAVRFGTKDDGELATVVVLAFVVVVPVQVFLRIVAGYRTLTSSRRF